MIKHLLFPILLILIMNTQMLGQSTASEPLRIGVIGLTHTHVHWILGRPDRGDIKIVGIVEPNRELAQRYTTQHNFSMKIVYNTMEEMIAAVKPEAITAFGTIFDHLKVVETCAPLGIHVMVEKPLAVSMDHAIKMKAFAEKHHIQLLVNYETTWYATNHKAYNMVQNGAIGELRKIVVHDGHKGPIELGINQEFLDWLSDPVTNGAGALTDFGCYGANLITWMKNGERPEAVTAVVQTIKPELYPKVDDEATIILGYPKMQGIIQASWNWPISRKDMEVYGKTGYIFSDNRSTIRFRLNESTDEQKETLAERPSPYDDPFSLFAAVVKKKITLPAYDLSSLENNMIVMEILDAAKESAKTGTTILLKK
ncbi:MAG: Gfo/Idh/MocA family oxidoreductase [Bacteroidota bacterium]